MNAIKIMVVDDSAFSRTILIDSLQEAGYEIVGEADGIERLLETYTRCQPDVVTMDIAMPGADGFECSRLLLRHDPAAKVVMISSMKDEETEAEARRSGVVGYLQKPLDGEALERVISNVIAPDQLYEELAVSSMEIFKEALAQSITRMTKTVTTFRQQDTDKQLVSKGITVVIGIIGRYSGSMILDLSFDTAEKMTECILRRPAKSRDEVLAMAGELSNVVAGVACSMLNKQAKALSLRVAPPSIFFGTTTQVVSPMFNFRSVYAESASGDISLGVGFMKGTVLWM